MFNLQSCGADFGVTKEIHEELAVEVADADALGEAFLLDLFHGGPCFLDAGLSRDDVCAIVGEAGGVALRRVDVFERDGEMDDVEVEVVEAPVFQLFSADGLNFVAVVEGVPEFGDKEKVLALYDAFFDRAGNTLAGFDFVAVVWKISNALGDGIALDCTYRTRHQTDGSQI